MRKIFSRPGDVEKSAKQKYEIPDFMMMENAAAAMKDFILSKAAENHIERPEIFIFCGKGNNGGDGFALARLLSEKCTTDIFCPQTPSAPEALTQYNICKKLGLNIFSAFDEQTFLQKKYDFILDCLYGTGFHGELSDSEKQIFDALNSSAGIKIACDIPSALYFSADYTITMGTLKTSLFSDKAKAVCGKIILSEIGLSQKDFEGCSLQQAFLVEKSDIKLPYRTDKKANKGTYGHTVVLAGEKSGAGIIAATAAMNFGSGLTSLLKTECSNLEQFKISPELMLCTSIPAKASALVAGPGLGQSYDLSLLLEWAKASTHPNLVLDADIFSYQKLPQLLSELNAIPGVQIILTPHLLELCRLLNSLKEAYPEAFTDSGNNLTCGKPDGSDSNCSNNYTGSSLTGFTIDTKAFASNIEQLFTAGKIITGLYENVTVIMKSANSVIANLGQSFVITDGCQSLAKGGSGDVLAGMCGALLAQGYSAKDAAITAAETHAASAFNFGSQAFDLTPFKLINEVSRMLK